MAGHWHQPPYGLPNRGRPPTKDPAMQRHSQPAGPRGLGWYLQHAGPLPSRRATSRRWNPHDSVDTSSMRSHSHRAGPRPAGGTPMTRNRSKGGPTRRQIGQGTVPAASQTARLHWIQPAGRPANSAAHQSDPSYGRAEPPQGSPRYLQPCSQCIHRGGIRTGPSNRLGWM